MRVQKTALLAWFLWTLAIVCATASFLLRFQIMELCCTCIGDQPRLAARRATCGLASKYTAARTSAAVIPAITASASRTATFDLPMKRLRGYSLKSVTSMWDK
jgi:hypothetical protein